MIHRRPRPGQPQPRSWFDHYFSDYSDAFHLEQVAARERAKATRRHRVLPPPPESADAPATGVDAGLQRLDVELGSLALLNAALVRLLVAKGVMTREEMRHPVFSSRVTQ